MISDLKEVGILVFTKEKEIKNGRLNISVENAEWVIDCFDKTFLNDRKKNKVHLLKSFEVRIEDF